MVEGVLDMNHSRTAAFAVTALFALSACSGSSPGSSQPGLPPAPGTGPSRGTTHARLLISVPPQKHRKKIRVHGHYISPATASLTYTVTPALTGGATSGETDISTSNPYCKTTGVVGYLACSIEIDGIVPATLYTFSFTTWDGAGGTGNKLSANTSVPFTATAGQSNVLQATLGGIATGFSVTPMTSLRMSGSSGLYNVYGNDPVKFSVAALDADLNFIIGPGAPQPAVSPSSGAPMTIATAGPNSPNQWTLTSTSNPLDPSAPTNVSLALSATPVPGSGGSTINATIPVALYRPAIYVVDASGTIQEFDEDGNNIPMVNTVTLPGNGKQSIAFGNHKLYAFGGDAAGDVASNYLASYVPQGSTLPSQSADHSSMPQLGAITHPGQLAYDPGNGQLYTQDQSDATMLSVDGALIKVVSIGGTVYANGYGIAYAGTASNTTQSIAAVGDGGTDISLCSEVLSCSSKHTDTYNTGIAFDPNTSQLAVCLFSGGLQTMGLNGIYGAKYGSAPCVGVVFDPYNRMWYVVNQSGSPIIQAYTESGTLVPLTGSFSPLTSAPQAITFAR
jgi:hypothetical protein